MNKEHPLIIVFYLDRDFMNSQHIQIFAESVNDIIRIKDLNAVAFFLPTDTEERIECINPVVVSPEKMNDVERIIADINKHFNIGDKLDSDGSTPQSN